MSVAVHGVLLSVLLVIPLIFTDAIKVKFDTVLIAPPMPKEQLHEVTHYKQPPKPKPVDVPKPLVTPSPPPKPVLIEPPETKPPEPPRVAEIKLPEVIELKKPVLGSIELAVAAPKAPEARTGIFSKETSAIPTTNLPAQKVQTGAFGDPTGIKSEDKQGKIVHASLGSFDLHLGPGAGNGSERNVRQGGFADVAAAAKPEAPKKHVEAGPPQIPVEILFKSKPDYTDDARKAKLEGEVLVRVLFSATGEVRILDVVRGLGHGLDENAVRAVQQIRFRPARRDGQPVDSTATVHIVFQLAY